VAIEDLVLGPPGVPAADQLGALIIVTGVGNNSPGLRRDPRSSEREDGVARYRTGNVPLIRPAVTSFLREELSLKA
ncbi:Pentatricopeptide repeat-containing protein, partial [Durusdinium trenchii]